MLARIKKLFGGGSSKPADEKAAAKAPLSQGEAAFKAQPAAPVPLTPDEAAFKAQPTTGPPLAHGEAAYKAQPAKPTPLAHDEPAYRRSAKLEDEPESAEEEGEK